MPEGLEKVYWETHKKMHLQVGADSASPDLDLVYTDSTPQRAQELCGLLTSAIREKTRIDSEAASDAFFTVKGDPRRPILILGQPPQPYHVGVVLPCADGTLDLSNLLLCAALGSVTGLSMGIALIAYAESRLVLPNLVVEVSRRLHSLTRDRDAWPRWCGRPKALSKSSQDS
jgi:hypothetical protein